MSFRDKYRQFKEWQRQPIEYQDSHDHHGCCNCGAESENNYCPRCGQKAVYGPITWHSVWQGVMDVWGVGTRSLPFTLWQLLWRPLIAVAALSLTTVVCVQLGVESSVSNMINSMQTMFLPE